MADRNGKSLFKKSAGKNGDGRENAAIVRGEFDAVAEQFADLGLSAEQLRTVATAEGGDEHPWDLMIQLMGTDEQTALERLSARTGLPFELEPVLDESANSFYEHVPPDFARTHMVAGIRTEGGAMVVAAAQPMQPSVFSILEDFLHAPIELVLAPRAAVASLTNRGYERRGDLVEEIVEEMPLDASAIDLARAPSGKQTDLLALARQTPVIRLVNMILFEALRRRASDVHIHPMENRLVIRLRVDGMLVDAFSPPLSARPRDQLAPQGHDRAGHRQPAQPPGRADHRPHRVQEGRHPPLGHPDHLRRARRPPPARPVQTQLSLDELGMDKRMQGKLMDMVDRPNGMVLVTGPTGSGKTTTLYAALDRIDRTSRNVMTIEDPVEYRLEGISQMQVNPKRNVTFATGLRALLRQDPDVILVGEIRDHETAQLAVQASLTGHLVLATLHTNDAPSAIPRLIDIGLEHYLVTSSLLGVLAQRLLRKTDPDNPGEYKGRLAVHELLAVSDTIRSLTAQNADGVTIYKAAVEEGFEPMRTDALRKIEDGLTDQAEVFRVLH
jgi:general secretion pathway protein E